MDTHGHTWNPGPHGGLQRPPICVGSMVFQGPLLGGCHIFTIISPAEEDSSLGQVLPMGILGCLSRRGYNSKLLNATV